MHNVHLTLKSANAKTGPIPVSVTSDDSCPKSCPFNDGACYAKSGPSHSLAQSIEGLSGHGMG